jgi:hypothetical protein
MVSGPEYPTRAQRMDLLINDTPYSTCSSQAGIYPVMTPRRLATDSLPGARVVQVSDTFALSQSFLHQIEANVEDLR